MIGHEQIIFARSRGLPVEAAIVEDRRAPEAIRPWLDVELALMNGSIPTVYVGGDDPETTDLAFLRGLRVHLWADQDGIFRWGAWYEKLQDLPVAHLIAPYEGEINQWRPR
jgi:hypothetical protein